MQQNWHMPDWWYTDKRPATDQVYFENMSRVIFQTGLNWNVVEKKWSTTQKAFDGFSVEKVSRYTDRDVKRLLNDPGIIRNKAKVQAIVFNAKQFMEIKKQCDSFQKYLDMLDKSNDYEEVIKELTKKFKHVGPSSARIFLFSVGEKIKHWE